MNTLQRDLEFMERVEKLHFFNAIRFTQLQKNEAEKIARFSQRKALYHTCKIIHKLYAKK